MRQLLAEVVQDLQLTFQLQEVHVLVLGMWYYSSQEQFRIHLQMDCQLLHPLLRAGEALREEALLPRNGILQEKKCLFRLGGENPDIRYQVLL